MTANNQHEIANFQSLEELEEETSTDPTIIRNGPSVGHHSPVAQQNSTLTQDSITVAPSTPGMYRQRTHKDSTTSLRGHAPFERKLSSRALQMSGESTGSNTIMEGRKISRLEPTEHGTRKISQNFDTRSVVSMRSIAARSHMSSGSEMRSSQEKTEDDRKMERIERFW